MSDPSDEAKREVRADTRDVRADARDDRAGARDTRADVRDVAAEARDERADTRDSTVGEREVTVEDKEGRVIALLDRVVRIFKIIIFLVFVLVVISGGNFGRSFINQNATEDAEAAANKATAAATHLEEIVIQGRDISQDTLDELRAVIARSQQSSGDPDAVRNALAAIDRIEHHLCGGKCPEP